MVGRAALAAATALCMIWSCAAVAGDAAVLAELKRLAERIEKLEARNRELEKALESDRLSEKEPELVMRLKAVEFQTLSMQKQARQIEALEGITVGASLTGVVQKVNRNGAASATRAPARARIWAKRQPRPLEAPVTSAVLPSRRIDCSMLFPLCAKFSGVTVARSVCGGKQQRRSSSGAVDARLRHFTHAKMFS